MTAPRILLHIGTHKTGSTSIQQFLHQRRDRLAAHGVAFYRGRYLPSNHVELHSAAIRTERPTPFKLDRDLHVDDAYRAGILAEVAAFLASCQAQHAVFSAEGLSYLRYPDELDRLQRLFSGYRVDILVYLRDVEDYRCSHLAEFARRRERGGRVTGDFADLSAGSWLLDYRTRLKPYRQTFGSEHVHVMDYDVEVARDGSVIPSFLRMLGIADGFAPADWSDFGYNRSAPADPPGA